MSVSSAASTSSAAFYSYGTSYSAPPFGSYTGNYQYAGPVDASSSGGSASQNPPGSFPPNSARPPFPAAAAAANGSEAFAPASYPPPTYQPYNYQSPSVDAAYAQQHRHSASSSGYWPYQPDAARAGDEQAPEGGGEGAEAAYYHQQQQQQQQQQAHTAAQHQYGMPHYSMLPPSSQYYRPASAGHDGHQLLPHSSNASPGEQAAEVEEVAAAAAAAAAAEEAGTGPSRTGSGTMDESGLLDAFGSERSLSAELNDKSASVESSTSGLAALGESSAAGAAASSSPKKRKGRRKKGEAPSDSANRRYRCEICVDEEKVFARPSALKIHMVSGGCHICCDHWLTLSLQLVHTKVKGALEMRRNF